MWTKMAYIFFNIITIFLLNSCQHLTEIMKFDIDLEFNENNKSSIIFETKSGCSKTNFKFTEIFLKEVDLIEYNCFVASNFIEYEGTIKRYFEMDFFNTITHEYFNENNLVVLVFDLHDEDILKNGKFVKSNSGKYIFEIEVWDNGTPIIFRNKCVYHKILILEIDKP